MKTDINKIHKSRNTLQRLRFSNPLRIIAGQMNLSPVRTKFVTICSTFKQKINKLLVSETKINDTILVAQFG